MKIFYGYYDEENQHELVTDESELKITERINDLMQIYDWVTVVDNEGKDITINFC